MARARRKVKHKLLYIGARKAHLKGVCEEVVLEELPEETVTGEGTRGKLKGWLHGMGPAGQAWEMFVKRLESIETKKSKKCP